MQNIMHHAVHARYSIWARQSYGKPIKVQGLLENITKMLADRQEQQRIEQVSESLKELEVEIDPVIIEAQRARLSRTPQRLSIAT